MTRQTIEARQAIASYVQCIFAPDDVIEVRLLPSKKSSWHSAKDLPGQVSRLSVANEAGQNIYCGINPRSKIGGKKAQDVALAWCLFCDWDAKNLTATDPDGQIAEARQRIADAGLPEPTLIVHSGHGFHAYWRLREPLSDLAEWSHLQQALISAVDSDKKIQDPPRILRIPGFLNCKEVPAVPCRIVDGDPNRRYPVDELRGTLIAFTPRTRPTNGTTNESQPNRSAVDAKILDRARRYLTKLPPAVSGQHGHDRTFHAACRLVEGFGLTPAQAYPLLAEWNANCEPPWTEKELRHKLEDADSEAVDRGHMLRGESRDTYKTNGHAAQAEQHPKPDRLAVISSAELASTDTAIPYLIDGLLVAGQPCILAGGKKTLKTNISVDLVLSLAQAGLFLGKFKVQNAARVALLSGESGRATIAETARRIAVAKRCSLENFEHVLWGFNLPRLGEPGSQESLDEFIRSNQLNVVVIDPTYLALPLGDSAKNLFLVGEKLVGVNEVFQQNECTPIFSHHTRMHLANPFDPPELEDIAWAGFQEWARQWLLIGRRKRYDPERGGRHELWLNIGGSAGHSGLWAVNIDEGTREDEGGRRWEVEVLKPSQARAESVASEQERRKAAKAEKEGAEAAKDRKAILEAISTLPNGDTETAIRHLSGIRSDRFRGAFAGLLAEREIESCTITKGNNRSYAAYRRSGTQPDAPGQPHAS